MIYFSLPLLIPCFQSSLKHDNEIILDYQPSKKAIYSACLFSFLCVPFASHTFPWGSDILDYYENAGKCFPT